MAYTMLTWSIQLHRLADQLIRDEPLPNRNSDVYQRHRRLIQNNMDAARYNFEYKKKLLSFSLLIFTS